MRDDTPFSSNEKQSSLSHEGNGRFSVASGLAGESFDGSEIVICAELFAPVNSEDARAAFRDYLTEVDENDLMLYVSNEPAHVFQGEEALAGPVSIHYQDQGPWEIYCQLSVGYDRWDDWPELHAFFVEWTKQRPIEFLDLVQDERSVPSINLWNVSFKWSEEPETLDDIIRLGEEVVAIGQAFDRLELSGPMIADIVRSGHAEAVIGIKESVDFDAKQSAVLSTAVQRHEMAKDIAAMSNTHKGGVLLIGASTKRTKAGDVVTKISPVKEVEHLISLIEEIMRTHIMPVPEYVRVGSAQSSSTQGRVVIIEVPPQDLALRPFVVIGAAIEGKLQNNYISVPVRVGENTTFMSPASIHASLTVGRALLTGQLRHLSRLLDP